MKGEQRLAPLVKAWWATVIDPKVNEVTRGKAYQAMTDLCALLWGKRP